MILLLALLAIVAPVRVRAGDEADGAAAADRDGARFPVESFVVEYADDVPGLAPLDTLVPMEVELARIDSGYVAPRAGLATQRISLGQSRDAIAGSLEYFHASALAVIAETLLDRVQKQGLVGVLVAPHPEDIDVRGERDLRPPERRSLRLRITLGRVKELRSIAVGDRIRSDWKVNNPSHRWIRHESPIQPSAAQRDGTTDLVRKDLLEDYLFRLNRRSGRRVDAALASSTEGDGVALDFRVYESKPWFVYAQSSDTGTERTDEWQHRFGYVHRQLTGRDDVLSFQYTNAGINAVHAIHASYEAPWFGSERPYWMKSQPDESTWQRLLHRDLWPWLGLDGLRWRVAGSYSRFEAQDVDITDDIRGDEWNVNGRLVYEAFQYRNFFVDIFAGSWMRKVDLLNRSLSSATVDEFFFLPEVGIEAERVQETSTFSALLSFETNVAHTSPADLDNLGRRDPEGKWKLLHFDVGISQFLEPLLFPEDWKDPTTAASSTLAHEFAFGFRGQYSFEDRLIPQASQVVGGLFSVRGYDQSAAVGDTTYVASAEYRFHLPHSLPIQREPLQIPFFGRFRVAPQQVYGRPDWDFVIKAFVDYGKTIRYASQPDIGGNVTDEPDNSLLGAGAGVELRYKHHVTLRADWGRALKSTSGTDPVRKGNDEFHFLFSILY